MAAIKEIERIEKRCQEPFLNDDRRASPAPSPNTVPDTFSLADKNTGKPVAPAAYTLIEMVIVLLIVGILAATAAPKYSASLTSFRLEALVHRIAGDIKHARRTAQQNSSAQTISFDVVNNSYTLTGVTDIDRRSRTYQFSLGQSEYDCRLVSADFGGSPVLSFDVYGRPQSVGTIVVQSGGVTRTITLNDVGQVSSL